jgi:hypothetical protein
VPAYSNTKERVLSMSVWVNLEVLTAPFSIMSRLERRWKTKRDSPCREASYRYGIRAPDNRAGLQSNSEYKYIFFSFSRTLFSFYATTQSMHRFVAFSTQAVHLSKWIRESLPLGDFLYSRGHGVATSESDTKQFTVPDLRVIVVLSHLQGDINVTSRNRRRIHTKIRPNLWSCKKSCGSAIIWDLRLFFI